MAEEKKATVSSAQIKLTNVRLSFPELFRPKKVKENDEPKYAASFLIDKADQDDQIKKLRKLVAQIAHEKWGEKIPKGVKYCIHAGDEKEYEGYDESIVFVSASSKKRPTVIDRDMSPLAEDDGRPYAGCYVHAVLRLWTQDNNFGKRVNAELQGVQFHRDGEAFGAAPFNAEEHFSAEGEKSERRERRSEPEPDEDEIPF